MVIALRLAKGGWYGGDPDNVLRAPADKVMLTVHYDDFVGKVESETVKLATKES